MINAIDNFFPFFLFPFFFFSLFLSFLLPLHRWGRANEACTLFPITVFASRVYNSPVASSERSFCSNEPVSLFTEDLAFFAHRFLHSRFDVKLSLRSSSIFSYGYSRNYLIPAERTFFSLFFLLNLLQPFIFWGAEKSKFILQFENYSNYIFAIWYKRINFSSKAKFVLGIDWSSWR